MVIQKHVFALKVSFNTYYAHLIFLGNIDDHIVSFLAIPVALNNLWRENSFVDWLEEIYFSHTAMDI